MSSPLLRRRSWRRVCLSAVMVAALGTASLAGAATGPAALDGPDRKIDAGTNADDAARLINRVCAEDPEKCEWNNDSAIKVDYGPERVIGDVLYNCSVDGPKQQEAETSVGIVQERGESTSLKEEVSVEASLSFLGFAESSVKAWANSEQSQYFGETVKSTDATPVPPGYKGWVDASILSLQVTGSAYVTDGIDLVQVENIDLYYPGYTSPKGDQPVIYANRSKVMTADEIASHCPTTAPTDAVRSRTGGDALTAKAPRARFKITVCRPAGKGSAGARDCVRIPVSGRAAPPKRDRVHATLTRAGRTYAVERNREGGIRLVQRRAITPGYYTLTIRERSRHIVVRRQGKKLHEARQEHYVIVPLRINRTRGL